MSEPVYIGFWARFVAFLVNSVIVLIALIPVGIILVDISVAELGDNILPVLLAASGHRMSALAIALAFIVLWIFRNAEPGKMMFKAIIVDANTFEPAKNWQYFVRYIGYYVSLIPLGIGFIWIAFDKRKRGWHDLMARTVVIRDGSQTEEHLDQ